ncbi:membrane dipeptidase [Robbsia sp. KACC 23696]|uniref:membrane dipeptidase n=1 Tax=Robbsia sp. KACC 23696 TaxID=3149231 RepID=UPI00325AB8DF
MSNASDVYKNAIVFDGLNICNWSRDIFESWHKGGFTGVSATCGLWENFRDSIHNVIAWNKHFEDNSDLILQIRSTEDIRRAKREGKTGVLLSWQNTSGIEDRADFLQIFRDLGVLKMQLTYNTQNYSGAGYLELKDGGLTGFGREVVDEMARVGIVCDLSHVGPQTSADVIEYAKAPPCFSHVLPAGMKDHKRNKSDELVKACGARGGIIGLSQFGPFMQHGNDSTIDHYVEAIDYMIDLAGEDNVGLGTDASEGHARPSTFMEWCNHDKGYARQLTPFGHDKVVKPLGPLAERPPLAEAMSRAGWSDEKMIKVLGENWMRYLKQIWGA